MDNTALVEYASFLCQRRVELMERIAAAAARSGRSADEVTLLAVSKTVDIEQVRMAYEEGYRTFGENRPQELQRKYEALGQLQGIRFDMIGNLQRNKINKVLGNAALVHSVSSVHLAEAIATRAQARDIEVRCLLEVNVSGERSKAGFSADEVELSIEQIIALPKLRIEGLMTMAPAFDDSAARATFSGLRELRDRLRASSGLALPVLSCGMSGDFEIAVEEGSTLVRLGRVVFDPSYADADK